MLDQYCRYRRSWRLRSPRYAVVSGPGAVTAAGDASPVSQIVAVSGPFLGNGTTARRRVGAGVQRLRDGKRSGARANGLRYGNTASWRWHP